MKFKIILVSSILGLFSTANAEITINLQFGKVFDQNVANIAAGRVGILVVSQDDALFPQPSDFVGISLTTNTVFGALVDPDGVGPLLPRADNKILGVFSALDLDTNFIGFSGGVTITYDTTATSNNASGFLGDKFALYWFPSLTPGATVGNNVPYGFYRNDGIGEGDLGFTLPADSGNSFTVAGLTSEAGGTVTDPQFTALLITPPPVPEPSTYAAIMGSLALVIAVRRRK